MVRIPGDIFGHKDLLREQFEQLARLGQLKHQEEVALRLVAVVQSDCVAELCARVRSQLPRRVCPALLRDVGLVDRHTDVGVESEAVEKADLCADVLV